MSSEAMPPGAAAALPGSAAAEGAPAQAERARKKAARLKRREEDVRLVQTVLEGASDVARAEAFRALVERYNKAIYWIAYDVLLDREEARDVAQETFIRVHAALTRFDQSRDFANWVYRIGRNLAIDAYRRRKRRATPMEDMAPLGLAASESSSPVERGQGQDMAQRVSTVLESLPVDYRLALTLREMHGMTPREIARVTDCSYPTARWRLHRGRILFRKAWEERYGSDLAVDVFSDGSNSSNGRGETQVSS